MCPKIDMMERECKKLEFGGDLNKTPVEANLCSTRPGTKLADWNYISTFE
jgi:hypothetical protein